MYMCVHISLLKISPNHTKSNLLFSNVPNSVVFLIKSNVMAYSLKMLISITVAPTACLLTTVLSKAKTRTSVKM